MSSEKQFNLLDDLARAGSREVALQKKSIEKPINPSDQKDIEKPADVDKDTSGVEIDSDNPVQQYWQKVIAKDKEEAERRAAELLRQATASSKPLNQKLPEHQDHHSIKSDVLIPEREDPWKELGN